jgi:hypothetical protein
MAGQYYTGTLLASPIVRGSSGDTYGTHHSVLGVGGYMEVNTLAERNAIPVDPNNGIGFDDISSGQRRLGMLVHVFEENIIYHLHPDVSYAVWQGYSSLQKLNALADNNNWYEFLGGGESNVSGDNITKQEIQNSHGFLKGDAIGFDGVEYVKLSSITADGIEPLGLVSRVIDDDSFSLTYAGNIDISGVTDYSGGTLNTGATYYISSVSGKLSNLAPTGVTEVNRPILYTLPNNRGIVLQYRGIKQSDTGISVQQFSGYTGTTQIFLDKTVTGATNVGYFSGFTGVQRLTILTSVGAYNGYYDSLYNYYYRDTNGIVRIGSPEYGGVLRRGYLSAFTPNKSWIYNQYTGSTNKVGWILADADVSENVGNFVSAYQYTGTPYTEDEWSENGGISSDGFYNNGGNLTVDVSGSLLTGDTYINGGGFYVDKVNKDLRFRTLISSDPSVIKVTHDNDFVYISGQSLNQFSGVTLASNIGGGVGLFSEKSGNTLQFRGLIPSGDTIITQVGDSVIIYNPGLSGESVYTLSPVASVTVGGVVAGTILTGKTTNQLIEEILTPTLYPILINPYDTLGISPSGTFEIGCSISTLTITNCFNMGLITPQYSASSPFRSGIPSNHCFSGYSIQGLYSCSDNIVPKSISNYVVSGGSQYWGACTRYTVGEQPKDSKGNNYCSPLPSGFTTGNTISITGILPWYWGLSTSNSINGSCVAACGCGVGGGKCVENVTSSPIEITFNSSPSDYIWFALPECASNKTCWDVNGSNNGSIGGVGNLFSGSSSVSVSSAEGCWSNCNYDVYVSCFPTGTVSGAIMCIY